MRMQFCRITNKPLICQSRLQLKLLLHCNSAYDLYAIVQYEKCFLMYSKLYHTAAASTVLNKLVSHIYIYMHLYNVYIYSKEAIAIAIHLIKL